MSLQTVGKCKVCDGRMQVMRGFGRPECFKPVCQQCKREQVPRDFGQLLPAYVR